MRTGVTDRLWWRTEGVALGPELALLTGVGILDGLPGESRTGSVVWLLDPSVRVAAAAAVVEAGAEAELDGVVTESGWLSASTPAEARVCADELHVLDSLDARVPPLFALSSPDPDGPTAPGLGLLPGDTVLSRVPGREAGMVSPRPVTSAGRCAELRSNWGSPSDPTGPCGARMAAVASEGDLVMRGGEGQGVLVVEGSLHLTAGARFAGVVLSGSDLWIEAGATLVGMARVGGALHVRDTAQVEGSACAAARALRAAYTLRLPYPLPSGARVHPL